MRNKFADIIFPFRWFFSNNRDDALDLADQLLALIPTEEAIRKDERERIINKIEVTFSDSITKGVMTATNAWQELKGE